MTMSSLLRTLFFVLIVRPLVYVILGLNVRHWERLPDDGPAIIVANHNSHLDTLVLMSLLPVRTLKKLRPVAAADYFLLNRLLSWFATHIIGIIPLKRGGFRCRDGDPLAACSQALDRGEILIIYPEGTRGEPERLLPFKTGIAHLAKRHPDVPVIPVFLHGLGKALPKGKAVLVPSMCDVLIGGAVRWMGDRRRFMRSLQEQMARLAHEGSFPAWI